MEDLWQYLPAELISNIIPRLPIRSIIRFKCVCKSWLDLIRSREFFLSYLRNSKSIPGLAFFEDSSKQCHFMSPIDEHEQDQHGPKCHFSVVLKFRLPTRFEHVDIRDSSVNGLLLFSDTRKWPYVHFICNPITRDYITLPSSSHEPHYNPGTGYGFGFGVSKMSGEYKMVRVFSDNECEVYTLGTGSWRSVAPSSYRHVTTAKFVNGNLHWLIHDPNALSYNNTVLGVSCFDLETELFTIFSPPPPNVFGVYSRICVLEERLAFFDYAGLGLVIWLMNEYGDDKSWTRKFFINYLPEALHYEDLIPIKVFKDGDILIAQLRCTRRLCYFNKTNKTIEFSNMPFGRDSRSSVNYTPSFLSLKTFSAENVMSF